jgi:peptide/nickel transport system substrate-binding protein
VFTGDADFVSALTSPEVAEAYKHADVQVRHLRGNAYGYLLFNLHDGATTKPHPILGEPAMRRALTMALDRKAIVTNLLDSLGRVASGPFSSMQWTADSTLRQIAFDRDGATRLLDSLGWKAGANGQRMRGSMPLRFSILVPTTSANRQRLAVLLQEQWRQVGVDLVIEQLDNAAVGARIAGHKFDSELIVVGTSPSPNAIRQFWTTSALSMANGFNHGGFSDSVVDAAVERAVSATSRATAQSAYSAAYQRLLDQAPAIFIFEPVVVAAASKRLVLDSLQDFAWWRSIPSWRIAPGGKRRDVAAGTH